MDEVEVVTKVVIFHFCYRVIGAVVCVNKAEELNRSTGGWGFFGFIIPTIAMIWISFMKPKMIWDDDKSD